MVAGLGVGRGWQRLGRLGCSAEGEALRIELHHVTGMPSSLPKVQIALAPELGAHVCASTRARATKGVARWSRRALLVVENACVGAGC